MSQPLTAQAIIAALASRTVPFTAEQIQTATGLLRGLHDQIAAHVARNFRIGDPVQFKHAGAVVRGHVEKVNAKSVSVIASDGRKWRVAATYLSPAERGDSPPMDIVPLQTVGASREAASFAIGSPVEFDARGQVMTGTVTRINAKSISVAVENGAPWRVSPGLLRLVA